MKKSDDNEILEAIGNLRDLMVDEFIDVKHRLNKLEHNQNIHLDVLDAHTKMLKDLKQEQTFALARDERIEDDVLMLKKKLKAV